MLYESAWFITIYCVFTAGSVKFLHLHFCDFVGEELTVFGFVRGSMKKL